MTHASESVPAFSAAQQREAIELGAVIEHSFFAVTPSCPQRISMESMRDMIRAAGVEHAILSSDFGQTDNGSPVMNFLHHLQKMMALGFDEAEIRQMIRVNPRRILAG